MSLVADFSHYYNGTWIAKRAGNINLPCFVIGVEQSGNFRSDDFSHEAEQALYFVVEQWYKNEQGHLRNTTMNIPVFDPTLILESPDVGYLFHNGNTVSWTHINPVRQRAKGLMGNKIRNAPGIGRSISGEMVYSLFNPEFDGLVTRYIYINPTDGKVHYKGALVGQVDLEAPRDSYGQQPMRLLEHFHHISENLSNYNITLVDSL
ncbi:hypothetical protein [Shigella phage SGF2]|uniref:Uncharacterized protein n=1 Tax=Shigella phage SGF2 TaxID=2601630 RepID=A0A5C1K9I7_9CAUD|nr:hypothetical protein PQC49_gp082 [Shigella phage SGF2]QEM42654.1 hypothetical protein [Shigella phage SGF2]